MIQRYKFGKEAFKATNNCEVLLKDGQFSKVSHRQIPRKAVSMFVEGYFDSIIMSTFQGIIEALNDSQVNMIGVYGIGGVGKTTLVKKVGFQAMEDKLFDVVVMAEVTESPNLRQIQGQIADQLGLVFKEESETGRANRLCDRLRKEKGKVLVILDNIWKELDLKAVGIPFGYEHEIIEFDEKEGAKLKDNHKEINNDQRQFKILLTSRNQDVLSSMNTQKNFLVKTLSDEEAQNMFDKMVGDLEADYHGVETKIIKKYAGLRLAVVTMAKALKNKKLADWKDALTQLDKKVLSTIELSYNLLESEEAKSVFLLCCLKSSGHEIHTYELLRFGMGLDLFQDVNKFEEKRNRVCKLIHDLKASCLLLDSDTNDVVKMHDIIHEAATSIAKSKHMSCIQDSKGLKQHLERKIPKESIAISLYFKDLTELPERLKFPKLKLFLLFEEDVSFQIPDLFFEETKELKVLDLRGICFLSSLPSSFLCLTNLQTLSLEACQLGDIEMLGELNHLEILNLSHSDIEQLPKTIGNLTLLKLLDLRDFPKLKVIASNVLSSLSHLEELYMDNSLVQWEEGSNEGQSSIASLGELKKLSQLTTVHIHIHNAQIMPNDLFSYQKLERFKIFIGDKWSWPSEYEASRTLKLRLSKRNYLGNGIKRLLKITEDLYLDEMDGFSRLYELDLDGSPKLKHLHVQNNPELLYIVNTVYYIKPAFPMLKSLFLHNLCKLGKLCHGPIHVESLKKLRVIKVEKCDGLEYLFSISMTQNLSQLQKIEVIDCNNMKEIFGSESEFRGHQGEMNSKIKFSQLHLLKLKCLPQLVSFGFKEVIEENEPQDHIVLFSQQVDLPSLKILELSSINNIQNIWHGQPPEMSSYIQSLTSLTVEKCNGLKVLFSSSMVKSLAQLERLVIGNCELVEGVINKMD